MIKQVTIELTENELNHLLVLFPNLLDFKKIDSFFLSAKNLEEKKKREEAIKNYIAVLNDIHLKLLRLDETL